LVDKGDVQPFDGDLDDYRTHVLRSRSDDGGASRSGSAKSEPNQRDQRRQLAQTRKSLAPMKAKISELETFIEKAQAKLQAIDKAFLDPAIIQDGEKVAELSRNRADAEAKLEKWEMRWLELSDAYEAGLAEAR
ncbi:MAG: ABC transporter ATP-binding protein, partial [Pseudomonadota bacterium]